MPRIFVIGRKARWVCRVCRLSRGVSFLECVNSLSSIIQIVHEKHGGAQVAEKLSSVLPGGEGRPENEEESDAAWEALKRRVLDAEEHGASLLDMSGGDDAERALRELRAQLRQGWAEEVIRMQAQEESTRSTKKRRRNAGWWTCENGNLLRCAVTYAHALETRSTTLH